MSNKYYNLRQIKTYRKRGFNIILHKWFVYLNALKRKWLKIK